MQNYNDEFNKESIDTNENCNDIDQKGKKKSKFGHNSGPSTPIHKKSIIYHNQKDFSPVLILGEPQMKKILEFFPYMKIDHKSECGIINVIKLSIDGSQLKNKEKNNNNEKNEKKIQKEKKEERNLEL